MGVQPQCFPVGTVAVRVLKDRMVLPACLDFLFLHKQASDSTVSVMTRSSGIRSSSKPVLRPQGTGCSCRLRGLREREEWGYCLQDMEADNEAATLP